MTRILTLALGYAFLLLGVVGLFLPILQGVLFIVVGLLLLSRHSTWARRLLERFKARYPRAGTIVAGAEAWLHRFMFRINLFGRRLARRIRAVF